MITATLHGGICQTKTGGPEMNIATELQTLIAEANKPNGDDASAWIKSIIKYLAKHAPCEFDEALEEIDRLHGHRGRIGCPICGQSGPSETLNPVEE